MEEKRILPVPEAVTKAMRGENIDPEAPVEKLLEPKKTRRHRSDKDDIDYEWAKSQETHYGQFRNYYRPGAPLKFDYLDSPDRNASPEKYDLKDGEFYNLPQSVIDHINSRSMMVSERRRNPDGSKPLILKKRIRLYGFHSTENPYADFTKNDIIEPGAFTPVRKN